MNVFDVLREKVKERYEKVNPYVSKNAIEIVNKVEQEYNDGWIACKDRLPARNGYYTVTQERYSINDSKKLLATEVDYKVQFDVNEIRWWRAKNLKVIAWKENEKPYEPNEE